MQLVEREAGLEEVSIQQDPEVLELCGGTFEFLLSERDSQRITEGGEGAEVSRAGWGVGSTSDKEIVEVVVYVGQAVLPGDPFQGLCEGVKNKGG